MGRPDVSAPPARPWLALAVAALVPTLLAVALHGAWVADLLGTHPVTAFGASHVWGLDRIVRITLGVEPLQVWTDRIGAPVGGAAPVLGWGPALLTLPVSRLADPVFAYAVAVLGAPGLAGAAAWAWLRGAGRASPWAATAGAIVFATSTGMLNNLALGNVDKLSVWVYPAWLAFAAAAVEGRKWLAALAGAALVALLAPLSEPYLGLFLPLFGVPVAALALLDAPAGRRVWAFVRFGVLLGVTAAAMLPAREWFGSHRDAGADALLFHPAVNRAADGPVADTRPWITLEGLVSPNVVIPADPESAFHVHYVGLVGLLAALVLAALPGAGRRRLGFTVLVVGLLLVLGPRTTLPAALGFSPKQGYLLPLHFLEQLGYPTSYGSQYYRALPIVSLGVGALLAAGLTRRAGRRGAIVGVAVVFAAMLDAVGITRAAWPRPLRPVPCREVLAAIRAAPGEGTLLNLNLRASQARSGEAMLLATLHGRGIETVPRHADPHWEFSYRWLMDPAMPNGPGIAAWLKQRRIRFLLDAPVGQPGPEALSPAAVEAALGPPTWRDATCAAWDLGPVNPAPRRPTEPR